MRSTCTIFANACKHIVMAMNFIEQEIKGVWVIEPVRHGDSRGYFCETFKKEEFETAIGKVEFIQDNESVSTYGVLRGLHFQKGEWSQAKLVRVSRGKVVDVVVDLRKGSPTWGKHLMVELSQENGRQMFVPRGFAHGFVVLSEDAQFQYKVDNKYAPEFEATLKFDDPELAIEWPIDMKDIKLSEKDKCGMFLKEYKNIKY